MKSIAFKAFSAALLISTLALPAHAAMDFSKERSTRMKAMDSAVNRILSQTGGLFAYEPKVIDKALNTLRTELGRMPETFPAGSESDATKPNIWTDAKGFQAEIDATLAQVERMAAAAANKDKEALKKETKTLQKSCRSCHNTYREDEY